MASMCFLHKGEDAKKGEDASMTLFNSNLNRESSIHMSGKAFVWALLSISLIVLFGDHKIEMSTTALTYMVAFTLGANALSRGFLETGPAGKLKRSYSFHKL